MPASCVHLLNKMTCLTYCEQFMWKEMNQLNYVICLSLATAGMESSIFNLVKLVPAMFVVVAFFSVTKMTLSCTWNHSFCLLLVDFPLFCLTRTR